MDIELHKVKETFDCTPLHMRITELGETIEGMEKYFTKINEILLDDKPKDLNGIIRSWNSLADIIDSYVNWKIRIKYERD